MRIDAAFGRDLSLDFKPSQKSEGTFSEELDRSEAIRRGGATPKCTLDRVLAIFQNYLATHWPGKNATPTGRTPPRRETHFCPAKVRPDLNNRATKDVAMVSGILLT